MHTPRSKADNDELIKAIKDKYSGSNNRKDSPIRVNISNGKKFIPQESGIISRTERTINYSPLKNRNIDLIESHNLRQPQLHRNYNTINVKQEAMSIERTQKQRALNKETLKEINNIENKEEQLLARLQNYQNRVKEHQKLNEKNSRPIDSSPIKKFYQNALPKNESDQNAKRKQIDILQVERKNEIKLERQKNKSSIENVENVMMLIKQTIKGSKN